MKVEKHWLGHEVQLAQSAGGVLAFANPWDGVVHGRVSPWPPPELTQKLYKSKQGNAFRGADTNVATEVLGYYCDLQSVHSEDAVTWSLFGPLAYERPETRAAFVRQLLEHLGISGPVSSATIWLWRRLPHPDSLAPGGPEIDVGIQTDRVLILGEAKWRSSVGTGQGVAGNKDQIQLRAEFCNRYGSRTFPTIDQFIVLGIGQSLGILSSGQLAHTMSGLSVREMTWDSLGALEANPYASEFRSQLEWRKNHSKNA
jgi:hypothetical protein